MRNPATSILLGNSHHRLGQLRQRKWQVLHRDRSLPHFGRKIYHLLMGLLCFGLYAFVLTREQALVVLGVVGGTFVALDAVRLRFPMVNEAALRLFGGIMRREELKSVSGNSFYILGLLVLTLVFPKPVALLAVLYLAIGDPVAAIVGTLYGRHRLVGKKSLEGAAANFAASGVATALTAALYFGLAAPSVLVLALVGGLISVVSELLPLPLDDNFTIPVVSALLLTAAGAFLPFF